MQLNVEIEQESDGRWIAEVMNLKTWSVYKLLKRLRQRFDVTTNAAAVSHAIAQGYVRFNVGQQQ